ncbi:MAG: Crp/Fnr family transcriptional regulator [Pseudooceanicola sp.]|nr:Crp/Fnr family transcriptional regulator [Pseudooceanicola sp.]
MTRTPNTADWTALFQGTRALPDAVRARLRAEARTTTYHEGAVVFSPDRVPDSLLFLVSGTIRVSQTSDSGRDIVLYRVEAGESCVLTTACMLAEEAYNAEGLAETEVRAVALPRAGFDRLAAEEPAFRSFVFAAYSRRLIDLLRVIEDVAFGRIDVRLAERLLTLAGEEPTLTTTHQQLASELGTAREVISRVLQDFQKRGLITQTRGHVTLTDRARLMALARAV